MRFVRGASGLLGPSMAVAVACTVLTLSGDRLVGQTTSTAPATTPVAAKVVEDAPGTSLKDVLAEVDVRIWGKVKMDMSYDNFQGRANTDFMNYVTGEGPDEFNFNPRDTRFGFGAFHEGENWKAKAVLEIDFYGSNAGNNLLPRLRHGYLQVDGWEGWHFLAGQTWQPLGQQNPHTIDFGIQSWGGNLWWRVPQVRVSKDFGENYELLVTAFKHRVSSTQEQEERMPWLGARFQAKDLFDQKGTLFAINAGYRDVTVSGNDYSPWLLAIEARIQAIENLDLRMEFWTGQGIGREFVRYGLDYNNTLMTEIASTGGFVSAQYKIDEAWSVAAGLGIDDPDNEDVGNVGTFQRNLTGFANVRYQLSKQLGTGLELIHFATDDLTGSTLEGQRVTWSVWFSF
jgi:hypothetical protein